MLKPTSPCSSKNRKTAIPSLKPRASRRKAAEAQAAYEAAEDALLKSSVRAPFDGMVYSLPVKQGAFVQAGELLLQEADLSRVLVRAFVDEPDVGRLQTGQKVEITWDALPGRTWTGTVSTVPSTVKLRGIQKCRRDDVRGRQSRPAPAAEHQRRRDHRCRRAQQRAHPAARRSAHRRQQALRLSNRRQPREAPAD